MRPGRGKRQGKLLPFVFERASRWPCLTCENVTHPESKRRMERSDHCEPVDWKGERKEFWGFFSLIHELSEVEQFLCERKKIVLKMRIYLVLVKMLGWITGWFGLEGNCKDCPLL